MAAECDESCLDLSEFDTKVVTQLQAVCRGWLLRKHLKDAQAEFLQLVSDLDGSVVDVKWTEASPPHPVVTKVSKRAKQLGQATASQQSQGECVASSACTKCICSSCDPAKNNVTDTSHVFPERTHNWHKNSELYTTTTSTRQVLVKAHAHEEVQTDLKLCLSDEAASRVTCDDSEPPPAKPSLPSKEVLLCHTAEHLQVNFPEGGDSVGADSVVRRDPGWHVQDGTDVGELSEQCSNAAVSTPPFLHATDTSTATNRTIFLTPTCSNSSITTTTSGSTPGERLVGSAASLAVGGGMPSLEPVSESGPGSKRRAVDSFHGDQTSLWDSGSSANQESTRPQVFCGSALMGQHLPQGKTADATEEMLRSQSIEELLGQRQNVAMELLWVQQAIISRKKYLKLKQQMEVTK